MGEAVDVEGQSLRLPSRVLPLLPTVEEGNAERVMRLMRPRPVGTEDVEELSLRLLPRVPPLPLLPTVEEGNAEVPIRKIRVRKLTVEEVMMRKLNVWVFAEGLIL